MRLLIYAAIVQSVKTKHRRPWLAFLQMSMENEMVTEDRINFFHMVIQLSSPSVNSSVNSSAVDFFPVQS